MNMPGYMRIVINWFYSPILNIKFDLATRNVIKPTPTVCTSFRVAFSGILYL